MGGGVYEIFMGNSGNGGSRLLPHLKRPCIITKICVKSLSKPRSFHLDSSVSSLVTDVNSILNDESIELVVEVMGGTTEAKTVVLQALASGKSVVTANKALIAEHMNEIESTIKAHPGSQYFAYEAAVCGGIPIVQTLQSCYAGDVIHQVMGILNGTANFLIEKMEQGEDFDGALMEAQELGFAEADPTAAVEGHDVRAEIAILAKLAFGVTVSPVEETTIPCMGISELEPIDFEYAKLLKCKIKLLGTAGRMSQFAQYDGALSVYVSPVMIPNTHLLASARGSGNCVAINSANMGMCSFTGPGAGRFPTANSVVADIVRIANNTPGATDAFPLQSKIEVDCDYTAAFYIRIPFMDSIGIIRRVGELAECSDVSIHSILQNPIIDRMEADFCLTTEECKLSQVKSLCNDLEQLDFVRAPPIFMPLLSEQD